MNAATELDRTATFTLLLYPPKGHGGPLDFTHQAPPAEGRWITCYRRAPMHTIGDWGADILARWGAQVGRVVIKNERTGDAAVVGREAPVSPAA